MALDEAKQSNFDEELILCYESFASLYRKKGSMKNIGIHDTFLKNTVIHC